MIIFVIFQRFEKLTQAITFACIQVFIASFNKIKHHQQLDKRQTALNADGGACDNKFRQQSVITNEKNDPSLQQ